MLTYKTRIKLKDIESLKIHEDELKKIDPLIKISKTIISDSLFLEVVFSCDSDYKKYVDALVIKGINYIG